MSKPLFYILATTLYSSVMTSQLANDNPYPVLPIELIEVISTAFNPSMHPKEVKIFLRNISLVNKTLRNKINPYIHDACHTRTLIRKISGDCKQNITAKIINSPGSQIYLNKNTPLYNQILKFRPKTIKRFLSNGGDPNYCPSYKKKALIFITLADYEKTKLLLECGANPNVEYNRKTPLAYAIAKNDLKLIKLLCNFNPTSKYLTYAISLHNMEALELLLETTEPNEIHKAFAYALEHLNEEAIKLLLTKNICLSNHLCHAVLIAYHYSSNKMKNRNNIQKILHIIDLMCQKGAWNTRAYCIAQNTRKLPVEIMQSLEKGRIIANIKYHEL